jgi:hypothetical protein
MAVATIDDLAIVTVLRGYLMKSDGSVVCPFEHDLANGCQLQTDARTEDKG